MEGWLSGRKRLTANELSVEIRSTGSNPVPSAKNFRKMEVQIQYQDMSGNWRTLTVLQYNIPALVLQAMQNAKQSFPDSRVRAVDIDGRLIDMLP